MPARGPGLMRRIERAARRYGLAGLPLALARRVRVLSGLPPPLFIAPAVIESGLHRHVVLDAMGESEVTIAIQRPPLLVDRERASEWPGVISGLFTQEDAVRVFERLLDGVPPESFLAAMADG